MKKLYSIFAGLFIITLSLFATTATAQNTFSGNVLYHGNADNPIPSVTVTIQNADNTFIQSVVTDDNGYYELTNIPYGTFTILAETELPAGGVELSDAFMVMFHMFGFINLEGYQAIAADVNNNGNIDWGDYWDILIDWLIYQLPFNNEPWLFDSMEYTFTPSKDGQSVGGNELGATCSGDICGSYILDDDKEKSTVVSNQTINVLPGETVEVSFYASETIDVAALYMGIKYDADVVTIEEYETNPAEMEYRAEEADGLLGFNWMTGQDMESLHIEKDNAIITLYVTVNENAQPQEVVFSLDDESAYITADGKSENTTKLVSQSINVLNKETTTSLNNFEESVSIYPNPATDILFVEAQNQNSTFTVRDLTGKAVISVLLDDTKSAIDVTNLSPGYYIYQIENINSVLSTGKVLITK